MAEHLWPGERALPGPRQATAVPQGAGPIDGSERQDPDHLALHVYQAIQRGDNRLALSLGAEAQAAADERPALLARLLAWEAQAAAALGEGPRARQALRRARGLAQSMGDTEGDAALASLQAQLMQRLMASRPPPPDEGTELGRALAAFDRGDVEGGARMAALCVELARADGDPRAQVLALLALARSPTAAAGAIEEAHRVADASGDFNLVTAVSKAARAAGLTLAPHVF